jgi:hypothetical protein
MTVDPFLAGIFCAIAVEAIALVICAIISRGR